MVYGQCVQLKSSRGLTGLLALRRFHPLVVLHLDFSCFLQVSPFDIVVPVIVNAHVSQICLIFSSLFRISFPNFEMSG